MPDAPAKFVPTAWIDITPGPLAAAKTAGFASIWPQYRVFPDGIVMFRGAAVRDSGNWALANLIGSIPANICRAIGLRFVSVDFGNAISFSSNGQINWAGATSTTAYFDGIVFCID